MGRILPSDEHCRWLNNNARQIHSQSVLLASFGPRPLAIWAGYLEPKAEGVASSPRVTVHILTADEHQRTNETQHQDGSIYFENVAVGAVHVPRNDDVVLPQPQIELRTTRPKSSPPPISAL